LQTAFKKQPLTFATYRRYDNIMNLHIPGDEARIGKFSGIRVLKAVTGTASNVFNVVFVTYIFFHRPARDPSVHYNLSAIIVAWTEFVLIHTLLAQLVCSSYAFSYFARHGGDISDGAFALVNSFNSLHLNLLKFVSLCNPGKLAAMAKRMSLLQQIISKNNRTQTSKPISRCFSVIFYVEFGAITIFLFVVASISLALKVTQMEFVIAHSAKGWTLGNWVTYVGFLNHLTQIGATNPLDDVMTFIFDADLDGEPDVAELLRKSDFTQDLFSAVWRKRPRTAFFWLLMLGVEDLSYIVMRVAQPSVRDDAGVSRIEAGDNTAKDCGKAFENGVIDTTSNNTHVRLMNLPLRISRHDVKSKLSHQSH
jgi:hypothetical protein